MATLDDIEDHCWNFDDMSESELVSKLRATHIDPSILSERDEWGNTLLHAAAYEGRSPEFCRVLRELDATLVKTMDNFEMLPIHHACYQANVEAVKYLFNVYPQSINIPDNSGQYPIHLLANGEGSNDQTLQLLAFLLKHDKGAVSTPDNYAGGLPLHYACLRRELAFVKLLFDAHPDGIFARDEDGDTPVDIAREYNEADVVNFFETQLRFHRQSQEDQDPDINGQLPLHRVLQSESENVSLGAIKLMVGVHRASVTVADNRGCIPLHYACRFGDLNIVKYFVDKDKHSLTNVDNVGNLPLHHACIAGKPDIVSYILKTTHHGVSVRNRKKKLPLELLLFDAVCHRDLQYVDTVDSLIRANPVESLKVLLESNQFES
eukprot:scaffold17853_cov65-Cyclotella_meneghiniana.AAC.3